MSNEDNRKNIFEQCKRADKKQMEKSRRRHEEHSRSSTSSLSSKYHHSSSSGSKRDHHHSQRDSSRHDRDYKKRDGSADSGDYKRRSSAKEHTDSNSAYHRKSSLYDHKRNSDLSSIHDKASDFQKSSSFDQPVYEKSMPEEVNEPYSVIDIRRNNIKEREDIIQTNAEKEQSKDIHKNSNEYHRINKWKNSFLQQNNFQEVQTDSKEEDYNKVVQEMTEEPCRDRDIRRANIVGDNIYKEEEIIYREEENIFSERSNSHKDIQRKSKEEPNVYRAVWRKNTVEDSNIYREEQSIHQHQEIVSRKEKNVYRDELNVHRESMRKDIIEDKNSYREEPSEVCRGQKNVHKEVYRAVWRKDFRKEKELNEVHRDTPSEVCREIPEDPYVVKDVRQITKEEEHRDKNGPSERFQQPKYREIPRGIIPEQEVNEIPSQSIEYSRISDDRTPTDSSYRTLIDVASSSTTNSPCRTPTDHKTSTEGSQRISIDIASRSSNDSPCRTPTEVAHRTLADNSCRTSTDGFHRTPIDIASRSSTESPCRTPTEFSRRTSTDNSQNIPIDITCRSSTDSYYRTPKESAHRTSIDDVCTTPTNSTSKLSTDSTLRTPIDSTRRTSNDIARRQPKDFSLEKSKQIKQELSEQNFLEQKVTKTKERSPVDVNAQKMLLIQYQQSLLAQNINTLYKLNQQATAQYVTNSLNNVNLVSPTSSLTKSLQTPSPLSSLKSPEMFKFSPLDVTPQVGPTKPPSKLTSRSTDLHGNKQKKEKSKPKSSLLQKLESEDMTTEQLLLKMKKYQNKLTLDELKQLKNSLDNKVEKTKKLKSEMQRSQKLQGSLLPKETYNLSSPKEVTNTSKITSHTKTTALPKLNLSFVEQNKKKQYPTQSTQSPIEDGLKESKDTLVSPVLQDIKPHILPRGILVKATEEDKKLEVSKPKLLSKENISKKAPKVKGDGRKLSLLEYHKRKSSGGELPDSSKTNDTMEDEYLAFLMSIGDEQTIKKETKDQLNIKADTISTEHTLFEKSKEDVTVIKTKQEPLNMKEEHKEVPTLPIASPSKQLIKTNPSKSSILISNSISVITTPTSTMCKASLTTKSTTTSTLKNSALSMTKISNVSSTTEKPSLIVIDSKVIKQNDSVFLKKNLGKTSSHKIDTVIKDNKKLNTKETNNEEKPIPTVKKNVLAVKKGFSCGECERVFPSFVHLEIHVNEKHTNVPTINKVDFNPHNSIRVDRSKPILLKKKPSVSQFTKVKDFGTNNKNPDRVKVYYPKKLLEIDKGKPKPLLNQTSKQNSGNKASEQLKTDMKKLLSKQSHSSNKEKKTENKLKSPAKPLHSKQSDTSTSSKDLSIKNKGTHDQSHRKHSKETGDNVNKKKISNIDNDNETKEKKKEQVKSSKHRDHERDSRKHESHHLKLKKKKKKHKHDHKETLDKEILDKKTSDNKIKHKHKDSTIVKKKKTHKSNDEENTNDVKNKSSEEVVLIEGKGEENIAQPLLDNLTTIVTGKRQSKLTQRKKAFMEALKARQARRKKLKDFTKDDEKELSNQKVKVLKSSNLIKAKEVILKSKKVKRVMQNENLAKVLQNDSNDGVFVPNSSKVTPTFISSIHGKINQLVKPMKSGKRIALHQQVASVFKATANQKSAQKQTAESNATISEENRAIVQKADSTSFGETMLSEELLEGIFNRVQSGGKKPITTVSPSNIETILIDADSPIPLVASKTNPHILSTTDEEDNKNKKYKKKVGKAERTARMLIRNQRKTTDDPKTGKASRKSSVTDETTEKDVHVEPLKVKLHIKMADFMSEATAIMTTENLQEDEEDTNNQTKGHKKDNRRRSKRKTQAKENKENSINSPQPRRKRSKYYVYEDELLAQKERQVFDDSHDSGIGSLSSVIENTTPIVDDYPELDLYTFPKDVEFDKEFDYLKRKEEEVFLTPDDLLSSLLTLADVAVDGVVLKEMKDARDREIERDVKFKLDKILDKVSYDLKDHYTNNQVLCEDQKIVKSLVNAMVTNVEMSMHQSASLTTPLVLNFSCLREEICTPTPSPDHDYVTFNVQQQQLISSENATLVDFNDNMLVHPPQISDYLKSTITSALEKEDIGSSINYCDEKGENIINATTSRSDDMKMLSNINPSKLVTTEINVERTHGSLLKLNFDEKFEKLGSLTVTTEPNDVKGDGESSKLNDDDEDEISEINMEEKCIETLLQSLILKVERSLTLPFNSSVTKEKTYSKVLDITSISMATKDISSKDLLHTTIDTGSKTNDVEDVHENDNAIIQILDELCHTVSNCNANQNNLLLTPCKMTQRFENLQTVKITPNLDEPREISPKTTPNLNEPREMSPKTTPNLDEPREISPKTTPILNEPREMSPKTSYKTTTNLDESHNRSLYKTTSFDELLTTPCITAPNLEEELSEKSPTTPQNQEELVEQTRTTSCKSTQNIEEPRGKSLQADKPMSPTSNYKDISVESIVKDVLSCLVKDSVKLCEEVIKSNGTIIEHKDQPKMIEHQGKRTLENDDMVRPNKLLKTDTTALNSNSLSSSADNRIIMDSTPSSVVNKNLPISEELEKAEQKRRRIFLSRQKNAFHVANIKIKTEPINDYPEVNIQLIDKNNIISEAFKLDIRTLRPTKQQQSKPVYGQRFLKLYSCDKYLSNSIECNTITNTLDELSNDKTLETSPILSTDAKVLVSAPSDLSISTSTKIKETIISTTTRTETTKINPTTSATFTASAAPKTFMSKPEIMVPTSSMSKTILDIKSPEAITSTHTTPDPTISTTLACIHPETEVLSLLGLNNDITFSDQNSVYKIPNQVENLADQDEKSDSMINRTNSPLNDAINYVKQGKVDKIPNQIENLAESVDRSESMTNRTDSPLTTTSERERISDTYNEINTMDEGVQQYWNQLMSENYSRSHTTPDTLRSTCQEGKNESEFSKCTLCSLCFKSRESLKFHMLCQHNKSACGTYTKTSVKTFKCKLCRESFDTKKLLSRHTIFNHSRNRNDYKCSICGQTFLRPFYLTLHKKTHRGYEHPYRCCQCGESFEKQILLYKHRKLTH